MKSLKLTFLLALFVALPCRANVEQAAAEPKWLALMHYRMQGAGWQSQADQPQFFLSSAGRHSPHIELQANLAAMQAEATYACRFPARYEWLRTRFALPLPSDATDACPELRSWYRQFPGQRISISFAASYLENPSSMFGHTFLKIYKETNRELLSPTINYAARTEAREGDLAFIRKGLFGGFPGVADELPFYRRLRTYTENEGRDIWEYELKLTPDEIRQLLLHLWEVRDGTFNYYFLDENCAYRTLALIDVVRPHLGLLRNYRALTVPVETIRTLQANGIAGERTLWPAFPKLVRHHERQLDRADVRLAAQIADNAQPPASVAHFAPARQAAILQLAYEYLSVKISRDQAGRETRKSTANAILGARMALVSPGTLAPDVPIEPPESGHDGSALSIGRYDAVQRSGVSLAWAGFEHTLADRLAGYEPHAEMTVLRPEVRFDGADNARLHRVDWLFVQSTLPTSSLFRRAAWRLSLATERKHFDDREHVVTTLGYNAGQAWGLGNAVLAVMPGIGLEAGDKGGAAGTLAILLTRQGSLWSAQLALNAEKVLLGSSVYRSNARFTTSLALSRNMAIQLVAKRAFHPRPENDIGIALKVHLQPLAFTR